MLGIQQFFNTFLLFGCVISFLKYDLFQLSLVLARKQGAWGVLQCTHKFTTGSTAMNGMETSIRNPSYSQKGQIYSGLSVAPLHPPPSPSPLATLQHLPAQGWDWDLLLSSEKGAITE